MLSAFGLSLLRILFWFLVSQLAGHRFRHRLHRSWILHRHFLIEADLPVPVDDDGAALRAVVRLFTGEHAVLLDHSAGGIAEQVVGDTVLGLELGMAERAACAFMSVVMCMVLGASVGSQQIISHDRANQHALLTGGVLGMLLLLQSMHFRRWKMWAIALTISSLFIAATFLHSLQAL